VVLVEHNDKSEFPIITYDEAEGVARAVRHLAGSATANSCGWTRGLIAAGARASCSFRSVKDAGLRGGACRFEPQPPAQGGTCSPIGPGGADQAACPSRAASPA